MESPLKFSAGEDIEAARDSNDLTVEDLELQVEAVDCDQKSGSSSESSICLRIT